MPMGGGYSPPPNPPGYATANGFVESFFQIFSHMDSEPVNPKASVWENLSLEQTSITLPQA